MAKKDKKAKATTVNEDTIENCTNAKIVMTLEAAAKLETTPAGDYFVDTPIGKVRVRKSETGRLSWQLDGKQIARSPLYNQMKDAGNKAPEEPQKEKKGKKGKKDKKSQDTTTETTTDGPSKAELTKVYKKKQLLNVIKAAQMFKKRFIKVADAALEKKVTGSTFIAALDDAIGEEVPVEKINQIFAALKK